MTNVVLVHGAGTGGWLSDELSPLLRAAGHEVFAPTLRGVGDRIAEGGPTTDLSTHIEEIVDLAELARSQGDAFTRRSPDGVTMRG